MQFCNYQQKQVWVNELVSFFFFFFLRLNLLTKSQLGKERVSLAYSFRFPSIIAAKSRQEFEQLEHDRHRQKQKRICASGHACCFRHSSPGQDPVHELCLPHSHWIFLPWSRINPILQRQPLRINLKNSSPRLLPGDSKLSNWVKTNCTIQPVLVNSYANTSL